MWKTMAVAARDRRRLQDILAILARFGLEDIGRLAGRRHDENYPERVCAALEALGPTFIKLGQILAARGDLLPPPWIAAFEKLHSRAAVLPWDAIADEFQNALGGPPEEFFAAFDRTPVAAGSMAQIYKARLFDGTDVAVKIRRPGIAAVIAADLRLLVHAAALAEEKMPEMRRWRLPVIVAALAAALRDEMDFTREARHMAEMAALFADDDGIVIPRAYETYGAPAVLVQDFIAGWPPADAAAAAALGLSPALVAGRGTDALLRMAFVAGVFHADPHPGNMLMLPGNRVAFIDWGMVGRLTPGRRDEIMGLVDALVRGHAGRVRDVLLRWGGAPVADIARLDADTHIFVARHRVTPLDFAQAIGDFLRMARTHGLVLPPDLALLFKSLVTAEGVARRLDPEIDVIAHAAPLAHDMLRARLGPQAWRDLAEELFYESRTIGAELPGAVRGMLAMMQRGRIDVALDVKGLEDESRAIERAGTRLAVAIVTAAFALGLAPHLMGWSAGAPFFMGLGAGVVLAGLLWLVAGRSG